MSCVCGEHDGCSLEEAVLVGGPGPCDSRTSYSYCGDEACLRIRKELALIESADDPRLSGIRARVRAIQQRKDLARGVI